VFIGLLVCAMYDSACVTVPRTWPKRLKVDHRDSFGRLQDTAPHPDRNFRRQAGPVPSNEIFDLHFCSSVSLCSYLCLTVHECGNLSSSHSDTML